VLTTVSIVESTKSRFLTSGGHKIIQLLDITSLMGVAIQYLVLLLATPETGCSKKGLVTHV